MPIARINILSVFCEISKTQLQIMKQNVNNTPCSPISIITNNGYYGKLQLEQTKNKYNFCTTAEKGMGIALFLNCVFLILGVIKAQVENKINDPQIHHFKQSIIDSTSRTVVRNCSKPPLITFFFS